MKIPFNTITVFYANGKKVWRAMMVVGIWWSELDGGSIGLSPRSPRRDGVAAKKAAQTKTATATATIIKSISSLPLLFLFSSPTFLVIHI